MNAQADAQVAILLPAIINEPREIGSKPGISAGHHIGCAGKPCKIGSPPEFQAIHESRGTASHRPEAETGATRMLIICPTRGKRFSGLRWGRRSNRRPGRVRTIVSSRVASTAKA